MKDHPISQPGLHLGQEGSESLRAGGALPPVAGSVARREKRAAVLNVIRMVQSWICDGCPTGDDSGHKCSEEEAHRILRKLDARMWELRDRQPNAKTEGPAA